MPNEKPQRARHLMRLAAAILALVVALPPRPAHAANPEVIRIGVASAGVGGRPHCALSFVCVAHERGLIEQAFAADGTKIEWHFYTGAGPAVNEALAGHLIDFAWQGDFPSIVARSLGLKTRLLMAAEGRLDYYIAVPSSSPAKTIADLKGRTLALFQGTNIQTVGTRILESEHLSTSDVKLVNLDPPTALAALAAGQIDATLLSFWGFGLRDAGRIRYIYSTATHSPKLTAQAALLVTDDFATQHPQAVDKFVAAVLPAAAWASDEKNRAALYELYAKTGYPAKFFADAYADRPLKLENDPLIDDFVVQQYRDVAAIALRLGLIRHDVSIDDWFDRGPLTRALQAAGLTHFWSAYAQNGVTVVGE